MVGTCLGAHFLLDQASIASDKLAEILDAKGVDTDDKKAYQEFLAERPRGRLLPQQGADRDPLRLPRAAHGPGQGGGDPLRREGAAQRDHVTQNPADLPAPAPRGRALLVPYPNPRSPVGRGPLPAARAGDHDRRLATTVAPRSWRPTAATTSSSTGPLGGLWSGAFVLVATTVAAAMRTTVTRCFAAQTTRGARPGPSRRASRSGRSSLNLDLDLDFDLDLVLDPCAPLEVAPSEAWESATDCGVSGAAANFRRDLRARVSPLNRGLRAPSRPAPRTARRAPTP